MSVISINILTMVYLMHKEVSLLSHSSRFGKNFIIFVTEMNSLVHIGDKKKYILILPKVPGHGLYDTRLTVD